MESLKGRCFMKEFLWHGRGGQGAFTAAKLLGAAYALSGENKYALAFPSFGPERRGAPIRAFTKLDDKPIGNRSEVLKADYSIFLDYTLFSPDAFSEIKEKGKILINTKKDFSDSRIISIDADKIALEVLKRPITNTIMLGALSYVFDDIAFDDIRLAIEQYMPQKIQSKNTAAAQQAVKTLEEGK